MKKKICLIIGYLITATICNAGNEPLNKGNGYFLLNYQFTKFNDVFDDDGQLKNAARSFYVPEIQFSSVNFQSRYGLTNKLAASLIVPAFCNGKVTDNNSSRSFSGLGDISMGLNYSLSSQNKIQPVISIYQNLPTGKNDTNGLNTGFGDFSNSIYCDLYYKYNSHILLNGGIGYQNRKKTFKNDFLGDFYINYIQENKYQVALFMKGKLPFTQLTNTENFVNYGLFKNSEGYLRYGAMVSVQCFKNLSVLVNYENYIKGQFIGNGAIYNAGIRLDLNKGKKDSE